MTNVGIVGVGFMGMVHFLTYQKLGGVQVAALCEQDPKRLAGDWTGIKGNFGPPGEQMDLSGIATYQSVDELLANPEIDLVDVTLPPALHEEVAIKALEAGKHVFCEKPLAMTTAGCDRMVSAARDADRKLLVGHVLPFFPEYAWALKVAGSGEYGRLLGGSLKRVISDPTWATHFWDAEKTGGPLLDLHVHDAHFLRLMFGMPTGVTTCGTLRNGIPEHWYSIFDFADRGQFVHTASGAIPQAGRAFSHGFEIRLERATLLFDFSVFDLEGEGEQAGYQCPPTILGPDGKAHRVDLGSGDPMVAFEHEIAHVLSVLKGDSEPGAAACELARDAIEICHMQAVSLQAR